MVFRFAGAVAQVCKHCSFVVARTDRSLEPIGRMGDLVDIPTPLVLGATGRWGNEAFVVEGRVQMDRAGAPGAPWQEIFVAFPASGRWCWVAYAQGRWYATSEAPRPPHVPPWSRMRPGARIELKGLGTFTVAEAGRRRVIAAEGELPEVPAPGAVTMFADIGAPGGRFGTIDYGDGSKPPVIFLGSQIDPASFVLDSGVPLAPAEAKVTEVRCPSCGGNLPIVAAQTTERVVCRYCGMASDLNAGVMRALRPAPRPPQLPYIPLGAEGHLRGLRVICIAFLIRGCTVEGERYRWREYLIYAGPSVGYVWLMEEDNAWSFVTTIPPGEVQDNGSMVTYRGQAYALKQSVRASVEHVVGELYWRVEIGETVQAAEYVGPGGKVSVEKAETEVTTSFVASMSGAEVAAAFRLAPPPRPSMASSPTQLNVYVTIALVIFFLFVAFASDCEGGGGYVPGGSPSFGGK